MKNYIIKILFIICAACVVTTQSSEAQTTEIKLLGEELIVDGNVEITERNSKGHIYESISYQQGEVITNIYVLRAHEFPKPENIAVNSMTKRGYSPNVQHSMLENNTVSFSFITGVQPGYVTLTIATAVYKIEQDKYVIFVHSAEEQFKRSLQDITIKNIQHFRKKYSHLY